MDIDRRSILKGIGKGTAATVLIGSASGSASAEKTTLDDIESRFESVAEVQAELARIESNFETVGSVAPILRREAGETLAIVTNNFDDVALSVDSLLADGSNRELSARDDITVNAVLGENRLHGTSEGVPTAMIHLPREFDEHTLDLYVSTAEGDSYAFVEGTKERYVVDPSEASQPISTSGCTINNYCVNWADACSVNSCNIHGVQEYYPYRTEKCCDFTSGCYFVDKTCSSDCVECVDPLGCYACSP